MTTLSWISRGGPPIVAVAALLAAGTSVAAGAPQHRYSIAASLTPVSVATAHDGGTIEMKSTLSRPPPSNAVQSGGRFVIIAKIVASPMGCASDTIFVDGFESDSP